MFDAFRSSAFSSLAFASLAFRPSTVVLHVVGPYSGVYYADILTGYSASSLETATYAKVVTGWSCIGVYNCYSSVVGAEPQFTVVVETEPVALTDSAHSVASTEVS